MGARGWAVVWYDLVTLMRLCAMASHHQMSYEQGVARVGWAVSAFLEMVLPHFRAVRAAKQHEASRSVQQAHEDAIPEPGSSIVQQAYEDVRPKRLFRPRPIPRRQSIELEQGSGPGRWEAASQQANRVPEYSREAQQAHEDAPRVRLFSPVPTARRQSADLEPGLGLAPLGATAQQADTDPLVTIPPTRKTRPSGCYGKAALPHAHYVKSLRIRNVLQDDDAVLDSPGIDQSERDEDYTEAYEGESVLEVLPEVSEYVRDDDPASRARREHNLVRAAQKVAKTAKDNLFYPIRDRDNRRKIKKYVLNVATMQAAAIRYYQTMIVEYGAEMCKGGVYGEMPDVLHKYCDALRDMDYMQEKARNGFDHDPFLLMSTKQMERGMMLDSGLITRDDMERGSLPPALDERNPILPGVGRTARFHATEAKARTINILCALFGGLALIVPMIIMKLEPSLVSVLVTTCSFVLTFALVIALLSGLRPNEVLAVTAGYAAVLVVFVGAQSRNG